MTGSQVKALLGLLPFAAILATSPFSWSAANMSGRLGDPLWMQFCVAIGVSSVAGWLAWIPVSLVQLQMQKRAVFKSLARFEEMAAVHKWDGGADDGE